MTYFGPKRLEAYLLSRVKGAVVRKQLKQLLEQGDAEQRAQILAQAPLTASDRKMLESLHPAFMGGNYLPDTEDGEIEIARVNLKSTTFDVTSVYARLEAGAIHYRVVDEYGGDTLQGTAQTETASPMTLGEIADFLLGAWPLLDVLESNFGDDLESALDFFSADSDFYPELDSLLRKRARAHFPREEPGDECPFCAHFNSPPADDLCEHAAAWVWDGQAEPLGKGEAFRDALADLYDHVSTAERDPSVRAMLDAQAKRFLSRATLIDAAEMSIDEALEHSANAQSAGGWSTQGMLGGHGRTIYVPDTAALEHLVSECRAICQACELEVQTENTPGHNLQDRRPGAEVPWKLIASGRWEESMYHSGHIAFFLANPRPGAWVVEAVERNANLDDVTEEDIEEGALNDDQIQAMWGMTLEEAQSQEYRFIAAYVEGVDPALTAADMAAVLYPVVCEATGKEISELDDFDRLLDL
jgi:predicted ArsR family transcriptional regulator